MITDVDCMIPRSHECRPIARHRGVEILSGSSIMADGTCGQFVHAWIPMGCLALFAANEHGHFALRLCVRAVREAIDRTLEGHDPGDED